MEPLSLPIGGDRSPHRQIYMANTARRHSETEERHPPVIFKVDYYSRIIQLARPHKYLIDHKMTELSLKE